jgi:hypothetical protein
MRPKLKPIRNLYHQFIVGTEFERRIEPQDLAVELHAAGKIDLIGHDRRATIEHYRESVDFVDLSDGDKSAAVQRIMASMAGPNG